MMVINVMVTKSYQEVISLCCLQIDLDFIMVIIMVRITIMVKEITIVVKEKTMVIIIIISFVLYELILNANLNAYLKLT